MSFHENVHQAAGHPGTLIDTSGILFAKPSSETEIAFYLETQKATPESDSLGLTLGDWMPKFLGQLQRGITEELEKSGNVDRKELQELKKKDPLAATTASSHSLYIVLQNVLSGYSKPNVIDIKLGKVLTDPKDKSITKEKHDRLKAVAASTTSGSLGFRVCGFELRSSPKSAEEYCSELGDDTVIPGSDGVLFTKVYGKSLKKENVAEAFEIFFRDNQLSHDQQQQVIQNTVARIQMLYNCLMDAEVRMYSSSILIAYESDPRRWKEKEGEQDPLIREDFDVDNDDNDSDTSVDAPLSGLHLIDFAHSRYAKGKGPHEGVLDGVENLLEVVEGFLGT